MTTQIYGTIDFPDNIDISDPSYDEDVWCRINRFPIPEGTYECYTLKASNKETHGFGNRIARIGIRTDKADHYERKGMIGVDSGMAGFYNCDNMLIYEDILNNAEPEDSVFLYEDAFVSESGYGDGGYDIYVGYKDGKIVDVYIEFI